MELNSLLMWLQKTLLWPVETVQFHLSSSLKMILLSCREETSQLKIQTKSNSICLLNSRIPLGTPKYWLEPKVVLIWLRGKKITKQTTTLKLRKATTKASSQMAKTTLSLSVKVPITSSSNNITWVHSNLPELALPTPYITTQQTHVNLVLQHRNPSVVNNKSATLASRCAGEPVEMMWIWVFTNKCALMVRLKPWSSSSHSHSSLLFWASFAAQLLNKVWKITMISCQCEEVPA